MNWLVIVISISVLLAIVAVTKVRIEFVYKHKQNDDLLEVKVFVWLLKIYTYSAPLIKIDEDSASIVIKEKHYIGSKTKKKRHVITPQIIAEDFQLLKDLLKKVIGFHIIVKRFLSHFSVHHLEWHTIVGAGNASYSAQLAGGIWALKGSVVGMICNYLKMKQLPQLSVQPHYQDLIFHISLSCIISFRIGHAIVAGLMLLKHWKRKPKFQKVNMVGENM